MLTTEFRATFGQQYGREGEPSHPTLGDFAHRDGWLTVIAPTYEEAWELVALITGNHFSDLGGLYDVPVFPRGWDMFPRGELLRIVHPAMATLPVTLLRGQVEGLGKVLVTVGGNGAGDLAVRQHDDEVWGPPTALVPAR